jgi:hypothetical protein
MPLSTRRRHKTPKTPVTPKQPTTKVLAAGMSFLEQLPLEILTQIFLYGQNKELILTSKTLYKLLGLNPSEWLLMEFFKPKYIFGGSKLPRSYTQTNLERNLLLTIDRAIRTRAFTVDMYDKWLDLHQFPDLYQSLPMVWGGEEAVLPAGYRVYPPKRWMIPENEATLISLLRCGGIAFPARRRRFTVLANIDDAMDFLSNPQVSLEWAFALLAYAVLDATVFIYELDSEIVSVAVLKALFKRPDVTEEMLNTITSHRDFEAGRDYNNELPKAAFDSKNKIVMDWALKNGHAPSADQLKEFTLTVT